MDSPSSPSVAPAINLRPRLLSFLSLAPVQSPTYPTHPPAAIASPLIKPLILTAEPSEAELEEQRRKRRSSSSNGRRFLKLGPVFWGGERGGDDYAVEE